MKQKLGHKPLPHDITLGALLVVLLASAFLIVLPRLHALRALPQHYYNLLPVATQTGDVDRDGIPDNLERTIKTPLSNLLRISNECFDNR